MSQRGAGIRNIGMSERVESCSLALRERARVRGNEALHSADYKFHGRLIPDDPVGQFISILRITWKMSGQDIAGHLNRLENRFCKPALFQ